MSNSCNDLTSISMSLHIQQPMTNMTTSSSLSSTHINPNSSHPRHRFRPKLGTRKSGDTNVVSRDDPHIEIQEGEEAFDYDDARAMSPRRSSEDLEKMGQDTKDKLSQHAKNLQESFLKISDRLEAVKKEHDKLDSNNKFLRKYIADLSSTLRVPAVGQVSGRSGRNPVT
ncbi:hypothetical protein B0O99DRAFT_37370 [Bisporella sp. PMI_857]|nr:hypothetical protein B0O99DRAFT_37370 [Bisporella sp. PMI_857]